MNTFTKLVIEAPQARTVSVVLDRPMTTVELWSIVKRHPNRPLPVIYQSVDTARVVYMEVIHQEPLSVSRGRAVA